MIDLRRWIGFSEDDDKLTAAGAYQTAKPHLSSNALANVSITKTADAPVVASGSKTGFTVRETRENGLASSLLQYRLKSLTTARRAPYKGVCIFRP